MIMNKAFNILSELYKMGNLQEQEYEAYSPQLSNEGGHYYQPSIVIINMHSIRFTTYYFSYEEVNFKEKKLNDNKRTIYVMCYMAS